MAKRKSESGDKPTKKPHKSRLDTQFAVCIPSTIISRSNAKNLEQITFIAYQVAKALTIFNVPEIVILDIPSIHDRNEILERQATKVKVDNKIKFQDDVDADTADIVDDNISHIDSSGNENNSELLANLLQFFVTPPYLVASMFKKNMLKKFKYASKLPKLSTLPFMNNNEVHRDFKEGLSIPKKSPGKNKLKTTKYINIGESEAFKLDHEVPVNVRVTVDIKNKKIVSPLTAYGIIGNNSSFGYFTRIAKQFNEIFTKSSFPDGYTSSIFINCDQYFKANDSTANSNDDLNSVFQIKDNNKVLLTFGNSRDLEFAFQQDKSIKLTSFTELFDKNIAIQPNVRIEDMVLITLTKMSI